MELIERYLQAVRFWLPRKQAVDIIAELSADLYAQVEDHQSALGRNLTEGEIEALLRQRGAPMLVANRYLPQRSLIGPVLFPIYTFVLKIVALCYLVPGAAVWIGLVLFSPAYRGQHFGSSWLEGFRSDWTSLWFTTFVSFGIVTLVFAIAERLQPNLPFFERWNPRKLPPVRNPNLIPRVGSSIEIAANLTLAAWWASYMASPITFDAHQIQIFLSPQWGYNFYGVLLLSFANAGLALVNLLHPYWSKFRATIRLVTDALGAALFCWLLKSNIILSITVANIPGEQTARLAATINSWGQSIFLAAVAVGIIIAATDIYRIVRVSRGTLLPSNRAHPTVASH